MKPKVLSFARKNINPLKKLSAQLIKETAETIDRLVALGKDEDKKIALDANKSILALAQSIEQAINDDEIRRTIATIKFPDGSSGSLEYDEESPDFDFSTVRAIE